MRKGIKLEDLVGKVSMALSDLNTSEIDNIRKEVKLEAKSDPTIKPEKAFRWAVAKYLFNPAKIREIYKEYNCNSENVDSLLVKSFKEAGIFY